MGDDELHERALQEQALYEDITHQAELADQQLCVVIRAIEVARPAVAELADHGFAVEWDGTPGQDMLTALDDAARSVRTARYAHRQAATASGITLKYAPAAATSPAPTSG